MNSVYQWNKYQHNHGFNVDVDVYTWNAEAPNPQVIINFTFEEQDPDNTGRDGCVRSFDVRPTDIDKLIDLLWDVKTEWARQAAQLPTLVYEPDPLSLVYGNNREEA